MRDRTSTAALIAATIGGAVLAMHCASPRDFDGGQRATQSGDGDANAASFAGGKCGSSSDLYAEDVPSWVMTAFNGASGSAPSPSIYEPRADTGLPKDWQTLHVLMRAEGATWIEVAIDVDGKKVRYVGPAEKVLGAASEHWRAAHLPSALWSVASCAALAGSGEVKWSIRTVAANGDGASAAAEGKLRVLPLSTGADVTFWEMRSSKTKIARIKAATATKQDIIAEDRCVGCHATTPDGQDLVYQISSDVGVGGAIDAGGPLPPPGSFDGGVPAPPGGEIPPPPPSLDGGVPPPFDAGLPVIGSTNERIAIVRPSESGAATTPDYVSASAKTLLDGTCLARPSVSAAAWATGSATGRYAAVALCGGQNTGSIGIVQFDAQNDPLHVIERQGDTQFAAEPAWSPTGSFIVYTSTRYSSAAAGLPLVPTTGFDLYSVPIDLAAGKFGGTAVKIEGASDPDVPEYHPSVSPDGELVAFTRGDDGTSLGGEIWIARVSGGPATRLIGDEDPQIADLFKGRFRNSWPRFTPEVIEVGRDKYYAIAFSSRRGPGAPTSDDNAPTTRMYFAFVRKDESQALSNVGMVLIPGQSLDADDRTIDARGLTSVKAPDPVK